MRLRRGCRPVCRRSIICMVLGRGDECDTGASRTGGKSPLQQTEAARPDPNRGVCGGLVRRCFFGVGPGPAGMVRASAVSSQTSLFTPRFTLPRFTLPRFTLPRFTLPVLHRGRSGRWTSKTTCYCGRTTTAGSWALSSQSGVGVSILQYSYGLALRPSFYLS